LNAARAAAKSRLPGQGQDQDACSRGVNARELDEMRGPPVVSIRREASGLRISLRGEIDLFNVDVVRAVLEREGSRSQSVVLDVALVTFMDVTALRVLLAAQRRLGWHKLVLVGARPDVKRALEVTGLSELDQAAESPSQLSCSRTAG
jgi:anti-anti-sigma factor